MGTEHTGFIKYFKRRRFGSEPPVMSILSLLPPKDRCEILEEIRAFDSNNIHVFDKLSMAYMKSGRFDQGLQLLLQGTEAGHISHQNSMTLLQKLKSMQANHRGKFGSVQNYSDSKAVLDSHVAEMKLDGSYQELKEFCDVMEDYLGERMRAGNSAVGGDAIPEWFAAFNQELHSATNLESLENLRGRYTAVAHPYVHHALGSSYLHFGKLDNACHHLLQAASIGVRNKREYWDTIFADSIGSSIAKLFFRDLIDRVPAELDTFNLFVNGYMFLSSNIGQYGNNAFESLLNRARMIMDTEKGAVFVSAMSIGLQEVLAISDFYRSSLGHAERGMAEYAQKLRSHAELIHQSLEDITVQSRDADEYRTDELVTIGEQRHEAAYRAILPEFFNGCVVEFPEG